MTIGFVCLTNRFVRGGTLRFGKGKIGSRGSEAPGKADSQHTKVEGTESFS